VRFCRLGNSLAVAAISAFMAAAPIHASYADDTLSEFKLGGAKGTTSLFPLIAKEQGFDRRHGLDLEYFMHKQFGTIYTELLTGANYAATPSPDGLATLALQGGPVHIAATMAQDSTVLLGRGDVIKDEADLRGKRVAAIVSSGSWKQFQARIQERYGLEAGKDYEIINAQDLAQGVAQVVAGTANFAMGWEPSVTAALNQDSSLNIALSSQNLLPEGDVAWQFVVGVRDDVPVEIEDKLVAVLADAVKWMNENPDKADEIAVKELGYGAGVIKTILVKHRQVFEVRPLDERSAREIEGQLQALVKAGGLKSLPGPGFLRTR